MPLVPGTARRPGRRQTTEHFQPQTYLIRVPEFEIGNRHDFSTEACHVNGHAHVIPAGFHTYFSPSVSLTSHRGENLRYSPSEPFPGIQSSQAA